MCRSKRLLGCAKKALKRASGMIPINRHKRVMKIEGAPNSTRSCSGNVQLEKCCDVMFHSDLGSDHGRWQIDVCASMKETPDPQYYSSPGGLEVCHGMAPCGVKRAILAKNQCQNIA